MSQNVSAQGAKPLDLITIGRASVDLYGQQIGTRLEDVSSFAKSVGGCPCNISVGTARLGLKSALLTRVGDEQMGRFIREQLIREGVETRGIVTDPERLTALAILAVENDKTFPLLFYRDNCADNALCEDDVSEEFIRSARAVLVSGTHFSKPNTDAAQRKAIRIAKENGAKVVFDIDYRPNLWGLAGLDAGESRYIASDRVSAHLKTVLADCDLIVGTEEEVLIASGESDLLQALKTIRSLSKATIVLKRGPMGCIVYDGPITDDLEDGIVGKGFPIEVYNVLGAGDAFMSGFLRGWLKNEPHATSATWANACGAFAVSRLLCAPEIPTWTELQFFLEKGSKERALRKDEAINHVHWATTRRRDIPLLMALAIDHRSQLEDMAAGDQALLDRIPAFKVLAVKAAAQVAAGRSGFGMLIDDKYGRDALYAAGAHRDFWIGKPIELPGSRPLQFEFSQDLGSRLIDWPVDHCIKVLSFYHPDDPAELKAQQVAKLRSAFEAARKVGREILIEIIAGKHGKLDDQTIPRALTELYDAGLKPDWWKLEPQASRGAWAAIDTVIEARDPLCRGVVLLGLEAPYEQLKDGFAAARTSKTVRGFAVGRTIFADAGRAWLGGTMSDDQAIADMAGKFKALVDLWLQLGETKAA
ncbi:MULTISPECIES: bifunctional 5-dehydro-2-deoxygluconokinase/5-dehydro-2-deoxyphosphogluconate aldolase [unclassified Ensifer]|uniref:bifunctional 5-dehydro-2-deoxygluconokinase/5-dehydro-2- deoxyphosphogluconate aldolase n=1 Tax=unclassified Ensifer TaxID=2633371 RepID=UPI000715FBDF|nr:MULTISPECIES: 5-dehydro-2-deoxygluconokinase [unclassified Ensifer]KQX54229.1 5-dehydro-2-deoxygluconokinase [Ensifer sp. Root1298]KQX85917.1 5-dehydro-2-deoxygluconokinase [Ensifer sp. Root1312]KRC22977.1 5-dehydro-2-deoxygluconokinase [Ensifer sp. Root74]KRD57251.1 5-dehydro-2-deoxygluconokinase [Ensifer sp. Root954]